MMIQIKKNVKVIQVGIKVKMNMMKKGKSNPERENTKPNNTS